MMVIVVQCGMFVATNAAAFAFGLQAVPFLQEAGSGLQETALAAWQGRVIVAGLSMPETMKIYKEFTLW